jgi:hypothetical protein
VTDPRTVPAAAERRTADRGTRPAGTPSAPGWSPPWWRHLRRPLPQALLLSVGLTALWRALLPLAAPACCDALEYVTMAADPGRAAPSPYSYRLFVPRLVHLLGGDPTTTFHLLSLGCLAATGPLVYVLARRLGAAHPPALLAMAGLMCTRAWTYYLVNPYLSDPATMLLVAVAFVVLTSGFVWALVPVGLVFAGVRELFVGLALPVWGWLRGGIGSVRAAAAAVLVLVPAWLLYRWIVGNVPSSGASGLSTISLATVVWIWEVWIAPDGLAWWAANAFALSLGCWWLLTLPSWRDAGIRRLAWWLLPVFGQFLFGADWSRFALYAFPVAVPAAALALGRVAGRRRAVVLALAGAQALTPLLDAAVGKPTLNYPGPSLWVTVGLMAATAAALWAGRAPRGAGPTGAGPHRDGGRDGSGPAGRPA